MKKTVQVLFSRLIVKLVVGGRLTKKKGKNKVQVTKCDVADSSLLKYFYHEECPIKFQIIQECMKLAHAPHETTE